MIQELDVELSNLQDEYEECLAEKNRQKADIVTADNFGMNQNFKQMF